MTENKNPCSDPSAEFERQRKRKVLLFTAILGCIFFVVLWFIFRPAPVKPQEGAAGINTSVPDGKAQATVGDKRKAAEQLRSQIKGYLDEAGKAQSEVSELKREVFRLQQKLENKSK